MSETNGDIIRFEKNIPVEVPGIKYPGGRPVRSTYGGDQVMITFVDGRRTFVPPIVEDRIKELGVALGEPFVIIKREVTEGRRKMIRWDVERPLAEQLQASIEHARNEKPQQTPVKAPATAAQIPHQNQAPVQSTPERPKTKLEDALKTVISAVHAATQHAKEIGFQMPPFTSEDIRTMANTLIIQSQDGGRR